jgi:hypothetical protein
VLFVFGAVQVHASSSFSAHERIPLSEAVSPGEIAEKPSVIPSSSLHASAEVSTELDADDMSDEVFQLIR